MTKIQELAEHGQAIWFDYIQRSLIGSGELQGLVDQGIRGVTSNPSIFKKAITGSSDYDEDIRSLARDGKTAEEIYEILTVNDIRSAADILRPVYDETDGADGFVSLEVNPGLANSARGTIDEATHLFNTVGRPNCMIKVPATSAGPEAVETLISRGVNVNVTLIFSVGHYESVAKAYIAGLEKARDTWGAVKAAASVASLFVSRLDTAVDRKLAELGQTSLMGKTAVANAKVVYARFTELFSSARWEKLAEQGARVQRPLWASTGTKNPDYPDTLYVDTLIGPSTVNTLPPATLESFIDHGSTEPSIDKDLDRSEAQLEAVAKLGIDLDEVTRRLQDDGVEAFIRSYEELIQSIEDKRKELLKGGQEK